MTPARTNETPRMDRIPLSSAAGPWSLTVTWATESMDHISALSCPHAALDEIIELPKLLLPFLPPDDPQLLDAHHIL